MKKPRLFVIPGSHPSLTARLMLERKGIDYSRIDLVPAAHRAILRLAGFKGITVPALRYEGRRLQGSREIGVFLDEVVPEPPLYPSDPEARKAVEEAERWGDEVLQPVPRRVTWWVLKRDRTGLESFTKGARLGVPVKVAVKTAGPLVALSARFNRATDKQVAADLAALPGLVDHVDSLIEQGVIGGDPPNAADFQIATSLRLLMAFDDLRPWLERRPAGQLALRVVPDFSGHVPPALPADKIPR